MGPICEEVRCLGREWFVEMAVPGWYRCWYSTSSFKGFLDTCAKLQPRLCWSCPENPSRTLRIGAMIKARADGHVETASEDVTRE